VNKNVLLKQLKVMNIRKARREVEDALLALLGNNPTTKANIKAKIMAKKLLNVQFQLDKKDIQLNIIEKF